MIIHRGSDPVAKWRFSFEGSELPRLSTEYDAYDRDAFERTVAHVPAALSILESAHLLIVTRVVIEMSASRSKGVPARVEQEVSSWLEIQAMIEKIRVDWPGELPNSIDVRGTGIVVGIQGEERSFPDVVGLSAYSLDFWGYVGVATWCDAWLPYDLRGRPQAEIRVRNAPRLRTALERIEAELGSTGEPTESKFSLSEGYTLTSRGDAEDPFEMALIGYDESWIAAE